MDFPIFQEGNTMNKGPVIIADNSNFQSYIRHLPDNSQYLNTGMSFTL